jgi:BlaI family penicillinase repressor
LAQEKERRAIRPRVQPLRKMMRRTVNAVPTPVELEILQVLWSLGRGSVSTVKSAIKRDRAYTTVQTILNILVKKNLVTVKRSGKAFVYSPRLNKEVVTKNVLKNFIDANFRGSAETLLKLLIDSGQISQATLERCARTSI